MDNQVSSTSQDTTLASLNYPHFRSHSTEDFDRLMRILFHAHKCKNTKFCNLSCWGSKCVLFHCCECEKRRTEGCHHCDNLVHVTAFHSKNCVLSPCPLYFCETIKEAIKAYPPSSYHLIDLDHFINRIHGRLPDLSNPNRQLTEEEDGEAEVAVKPKWNPDFVEQVDEISSTTDD